MPRTFIAAIMTILAAAMISGFSLAGAGASPRPAGIEHFRVMSTVATANKESLIATGEFTAGGTDIVGKTTDTAVFPRGTLKLKRHDTGITANLNSHTCLFTETVRGTYRLGHGTGAYAGIRGSGRFVVSILGVFARDSKGCTHLAAPATFQSIFTARGPVSSGPR